MKRVRICDDHTEGNGIDFGAGRESHLTEGKDVAADGILEGEDVYGRTGHNGLHCGVVDGSIIKVEP